MNTIEFAATDFVAIGGQAKILATHLEGRISNG